MGHLMVGCGAGAWAALCAAAGGAALWQAALLYGAGGAAAVLLLLGKVALREARGDGPAGSAFDGRAGRGTGAPRPGRPGPGPVVSIAAAVPPSGRTDGVRARMWEVRCTARRAACATARRPGRRRGAGAQEGASDRASRVVRVRTVQPRTG